MYGGSPIQSQQRHLEYGVDLLIGTPGRLIDLVERGWLNLENVNFFVMDEADRMLDMGFMPQLEEIVRNLAPKRQTVMWSATWPKEVEEFAREIFVNEPVRIQIGDEELTINNAIHQNIVCTQEHLKYGRMCELLNQATRDSDQKILIFSNTKSGCDELSYKLSGKGFSAAALHGGKTQFQRDSIIGSFKKGHKKILIATDVASRGLDIKEIGHVFNYDFPQTLSDYIHRIGRTGRAGNNGVAYTLFTSEDGGFAQELTELLKKSNQEVPQELSAMHREHKEDKREKERLKREEYRSKKMSKGRGGSFFERSGSYEGNNRPFGENNGEDHRGGDNQGYRGGNNQGYRGRDNEGNRRGDTQGYRGQNNEGYRGGDNQGHRGGDNQGNRSRSEGYRGKNDRNDRNDRSDRSDRNDRNDRGSRNEFEDSEW